MHSLIVRVERRTARRYGIDLRIVVHRVSKPRESEVVYAKTQDISTRGIYFTTDRCLGVNEMFDFSLTVPGLAEGMDVLVKGRARVLRLVQKLAISEPMGVAAVIEDFHIVRPEGA